VKLKPTGLLDETVLEERITAGFAKKEVIISQKSLLTTRNECRADFPQIISFLQEHITGVLAKKWLIISQ